MRRVLALVPDDIRHPTPGAFREKDAAQYVRMGINDFREAVKRQLIKVRCHTLGTGRLYLRKDLDEYLENLPVGDPRDRMAPTPITLGKGDKPCQ